MHVMFYSPASSEIFTVRLYPHELFYSPHASDLAAAIVQDFEAYVFHGNDSKSNMHPHK